MEKEMKYPILEIFGPTIQGEGMVAGQKTIFIRTSGCDYRCSWCDSKFTWDGSQKPTLLTKSEIISKVNELSIGRSSHVTISGGNPALINNLNVVIGRLHEMGYKVGLETQGSVWQDWFLAIDDLTISPKPPSSGMKTDLEVLSTIISKLREENINFSIKIVIFDDEDYIYAKSIHKIFPSPEYNWYLQVGNNDVFNENNIALELLEKYEWLCQKIIDDTSMNFVRPLPQLHTLLWGNKQGV